MDVRNVIVAMPSTVPATLVNGPNDVKQSMSSTAAIVQLSLEKEDLSKVALTDLKSRIKFAIQRSNHPEALPLIKEYLYRISKCTASDDQKAQTADCYLMMNDLVNARMREALKEMLVQLPKFCSHDALKYVNYALPINLDEKDERINLVYKLMCQGAVMSVDFKIMELAEKRAIVGLDAKYTKVTEVFSNINLQDIIEDMLGPRIKYPFSNPVQALERLLSVSVKPNADSLKLALARPDLPYAIQLLKAGAPTCNVYFGEAKLDQSSSETVELFARKKAEFCISYYEQKLIPFFEDMFNPIFSGRPVIDFMTNFINFSFLRAYIDPNYKEGMFCSSEESRARKFLGHAKPIKHKLDISYNTIKKIITDPTSDANNLLSAVNKFMYALVHDLFFFKFMELLPTKRSYERYLLLLTNDPKNSTCRYGDHRDSFSCLDPDYKDERYVRQFPEARDDYIRFAGLHPWYKEELEKFETENRSKVSATLTAKAKPAGIVL